MAVFERDDSEHRSEERWLTSLVAAGGVFVLDLLFHPILFMWRHRGRRRADIDEA